MMMGRHAFGSVLCCLYLLSVPAAVLAEAQDSPVDLANEAMELFEKEGRRAEALALFHRALPLASGDVRVQILQNLGKAYGSLKQNPEAWAYLSAAGRAGGGGQDAVEFLEKALSDSHVKVAIATEPPGALVTIGPHGGPHRFAAPVTWWFSPGENELSVSAPGYGERRDSVMVLRDTTDIDIVLEPLVVEQPQPPQRESVTLKTWGWIALGTGTALAVAGGAIHYVAWDRNEELLELYPPGSPGAPAAAADRTKYNRAFDSEVQPRLYSAWAFYGLGGAALASGLVLWLLDDSSQPEAGPAASVHPLLGPAPGLTFDMRF